ncbi:ATP-binding protein [Pseudomonas aeruginosa]|uniref:ATP-binding protein n=1 Tax=Pseudomonas aeruginosa TaxID=287 RepID=UPI0009A74710|nr:ATP-binding protein [Pseudomonas aeruginosa]MCO3028881.1 ATP-binding protein [Pseudomonas aeruginosa]MCS8524880.1 ATP-binding protein [Pseudomonas aeruginosa]MCT1118686.1 ATP-binding protein [Pseudomonas aeruginosa]
MPFCIESISFDNHWTQLCIPERNHADENIFTLIVGQNATGKSRLLRKIVSTLIFDDSSQEAPSYRNQYAWDDFIPHTDLKLSYNSQTYPNNVIAVSTGRHDRFPSPLHRKNKSTTPYTYIGQTLRSTRSPITNSITSILYGLFYQEQKYHSLAHIFDYLEFLPYLDIKLTLSPTARRYFHDLNNTKSVQPNDNHIQIHLFDGFSRTKIKNIDAQALHHYYSLERQSNSNIEIDLQNPHWLPRQTNIELIVHLLKEELLLISDITLIQKKTKKKLRLSQASSGQQCMLTMILGIAGSIQDNSLICIDEPEISLHPRWQSDIVKQIQYAFSDHRGCHFIIATHSPQIVSGLISPNGHVLNIEDRTLYRTSEYAKRSADFQLAEIFGTPGFNNEYLIRTALTILTKITRSEVFSYDDNQKLEQLIHSKREISENDPVYHLIEQIELLR